MKLKEYIAAIEKNHEIFCIDEYCDGRYIGVHLNFAYDTAENGEDTTDTYLLMGTTENGDHVRIDSNQEIKFVNPYVYVVDEKNNKFGLVFRESKIIPPPTM